MVDWKFLNCLLVIIYDLPWTYQFNCSIVKLKQIKRIYKWLLIDWFVANRILGLTFEWFEMWFLRFTFFSSFQWLGFLMLVLMFTVFIIKCIMTWIIIVFRADVNHLSIIIMLNVLLTYWNEAVKCLMFNYYSGNSTKICSILWFHLTYSNRKAS